MLRFDKLTAPSSVEGQLPMSDRLLARQNPDVFPLLPVEGMLTVSILPPAPPRRSAVLDRLLVSVGLCYQWHEGRTSFSGVT